MFPDMMASVKQSYKERLKDNIVKWTKKGMNSLTKDVQ